MNTARPILSLVSLASVLCLSSGCGDESDSNFVPDHLVLVSHGRAVRLLSSGDEGVVELARAEIPAMGLLRDHQIFNAILEPTSGRIYTASGNSCSEGDDWCWGNGRIDRFTYTASSLTYDGLAYSMNNAAFLADGITCAEGTETETGFPGQEGECSPNGMAFSADGTRLYVDDDDDDDIKIFAVDATTGDLSFLAEGARTAVHGLALHPNGRHLYNGTNVIDVMGDMAATVLRGSGGNSTVFVPAGTGLVTTDAVVFVDDRSLIIADVTDPVAPAGDPISLDMGEKQARGMAHSATLNRFVVVGQSNIRTVAFDGTTLTQEDENDTLLGQQLRNVSLSGPMENLAYASYFSGGNGNVVGAGGTALFAIDDATGELTFVDAFLTLDGPGRVAMSVPLP